MQPWAGNGPRVKRHEPGELILTISPAALPPRRRRDPGQKVVNAGRKARTRFSRA